MIKKVLTICGLLVFILMISEVSFATEDTGTLSTGQETGVTGTLMATPTVSPVAGTYTSNQSVTLVSSGSSGICYTADGTTPVCATSGSSCTTGTLYSSAISITSTKTIKAISCYPDSNSSSVGSHLYTINISSGGGGYTPVTTTTTTTTTTTLPTTTTTTTTTTTKPVEESACQWCGLACIELQSWMYCPALTPPAGYICTEVNGVCTKAIGVVTTATTIPSTTIPPVTVTGIPAGFTFQKDLWRSKISEDVRYLQRFLNSHVGTKVADTGLGSPGNETRYFGLLTKDAVIRFQNMYASEVLAQWGLTKGNGYVGQSTRKKLNELLAGQASTTTTTIPQVTTITIPGATTIPPVTVTGIPAGFTFQKTLWKGSVSEDVRYLQRFLNSHTGTKVADTGLGSPGRETNYFGDLTKAAVIKFQDMYASEVLAQWGLTKGNGYVGQSTRKKLNELLGE